VLWQLNREGTDGRNM